jgi:hypothetical protein
MNTLRLIGIIPLSLLLCGTVLAELKWEQTTLELHPSIGDKEAIAHFKYQNAGTSPVHIKSVHTSCGCTVAKLQRDDVAPGEKGEITATFNIGDRTGFQQKTLIVEMDHPAHATAVLTLKAFLPETLEIKPIFVYWEGGKTPKAKTVVARASKDFPVKKLTVTSSSPDFLTRVQPGSAPGEFEIDIEPKQTMHAASAMLTIQPDDSAKRFYARAQVFNPPAPAQ